MEKVAYVKCSCKFEDKMLISKLKREGFVVKQTKGNSIFKKEAEAYNANLPFLVVDGAVFDAKSGEPI